MQQHFVDCVVALTLLVSSCSSVGHLLPVQDNVMSVKGLVQDNTVSVKGLVQDNVMSVNGPL